MINPQTKLQDYLKSVPISSMSAAIGAILGLLVINCTDEDIDTAIAVAKGLVKENIEKASRCPRHGCPMDECGCPENARNLLLKEIEKRAGRER